LSPEHPTSLSYAAWTNTAAGRPDRAAALRGKLIELSARRYVPFTAMALAHADTRDGDAYFSFMDKAIQEREPIVRTLCMWRRLNPLGSDARFQPLLEKVGLVE